MPMHIGFRMSHDRWQI